MFLQRARYLCMPALLCGAQRSRPALRVRSLAKIRALQGVQIRPNVGLKIFDFALFRHSRARRAMAHLVDLCQRAAVAE